MLLVYARLSREVPRGRPLAGYRRVMGDQVRVSSTDPSKLPDRECSHYVTVLEDAEAKLER